MRRGAVALAILALLGFLAWLLAGRAPAPSTPPPTRPEVTRPPVAAPRPATPAPEPETPPAASPAASGDAASADGDGRTHVKGRVHFPDGTPVPGMHVQAGMLGRSSATTDADGRFEIRGIPNRVMEIPMLSEESTGDPPATTPSTPPAATPIPPPEAVAVETEVDVYLFFGNVGEGQTVHAGAEDVDFEVEGHVLRVRFTGPEGRALHEVHYAFTVTGEGPRWASTSCDLMGADSADFEVPPGGRLVLSAGAPGFEHIVKEIPVAGPPSLHEVSVPLAPISEPGSLAIHLVDDGGRPPPEVFVTLEDAAGAQVGEFWRKRVELDPHGDGSLPGVPPGEFRATFEPRVWPDRLDLFGLPFTVPVRVEAGRATPVDAEVRAGGWIRVVLLDADDQVTRLEGLVLRDAQGAEVPAEFLVRDGDRWAPPSETAGPALPRQPLPPGTYTVGALWRGDPEHPFRSASVKVSVRTVEDVVLRHRR